jgi:hypothetical protein
MRKSFFFSPSTIMCFLLAVISLSALVAAEDIGLKTERAGPLQLSMAERRAPQNGAVVCFRAALGALRACPYDPMENPSFPQVPF